MKNGISPEERLLRLIKGQRTVNEKQASPADLNIVLPQHMKHKAKDSNSLCFHKRFVSINVSLVANLFLILSCLFFMVSFVYSWFGLRKIQLPQVGSAEILRLKSEWEIKQKPVDSYLEGVAGRNIFTTSSLTPAVRTVVGTSPDLLKDVSLVGIVSTEPPQAIIEDKKLQKAYYLSKGQFFGNVKIEDIQEGKVILSSNGEMSELYL